MVSIERCKTYDYNEVKKSLLKSIENIGGLEKYLKKGEKVLLKVNLLMKKSPEEAVTTHPVFVKALLNIISDYGCKVIVGDSPGGPFNKKALSAIYNACGYNSDYGFSENDLNWNFNHYDAVCDKCSVLKKITVVDMLNDVDKVISVSKLKTHAMMKFTGAVKNMFGTIPGVIKAEYHFKMPEVLDFADMLLDVAVNANPVLSFMDGIVGMEGEGPSSGTPVNRGVVLASENPYELDRIAVELIGMEYTSVPTVIKSIERGFVLKDISDIIVEGDIDVLPFKSPEIRSVSFLKDGTPIFIKRVADFLLKPRPKFDFNICIGCGECFRACPPKTIEMKNSKPYVNLDNCIRCYCCQELCPVHAVSVYRPLLLRKLIKL